MQDNTKVRSLYKILFFHGVVTKLVMTPVLIFHSLVTNVIKNIKLLFIFCLATKLSLHLLTISGYCTMLTYINFFFY